MKRVSLGLVLALVLMGVMAGSAMAVGTSGETGVIYNGLFNPGDTQPQVAGELSLGHQISQALKDTVYKGVTVQTGDTSGSLSITVDTAYDLLTIGAPADKNGAAGDTVSFAYQIGNIGNATMRVYFDSYFHQTGQGDSDWSSQSGSYTVWTDSNNDGLWVAGDTIITFVSLAPGALDTVVLVTLVPTTAQDGESSAASIVVSNRAPVKTPSATGDAWQGGYPLTAGAGNDSTDTQQDTTFTNVTAPNVYVNKTVTEVTTGNSRPGDTLQFVISFDNDGSDSARGVTIVDAIPANTRYAWNSADTNQGGGDTQTLAFSVAYDSDPVGTNSFGDTNIPASSGSYVNSIRWVMTNPLGEDNGDNNGNVNYDGVYDNGRIRFQVWIR